MNLARKYRPQDFDGIVGQRHIRPILKRLVEQTDKLPPVLMFSGSRGTGKTSTARIIGKALNCEEVDKPCNKCHSCLAVTAGNSLDVLEVDAASNGGVAEIRKIKDMVAYSVGGQWRVVLIDECHSLSKEGQNALLKVLEEPPANTLFIMLTTEPGKMLDTIVSRSMSFDFRRVTVSDIVEHLKFIAQNENIKVTEDLLVEIANRCQGGVRDAVMALDKLSVAGVSNINEYHELEGILNVSTPFLHAAIEGNFAKGSKVINDYFHRIGDAQGLITDLTYLVRDMLVLKAGGEPQVSTTLEREERVQLSGRLDTPKLIAVMQVLWELKGRTRQVDHDQLAAMEMAFVLISSKLGSAAVSTPQGNGASQKLSVNDLKSMVSG